MSQDHRVLTDGSVSRTEHTSSLEIETSSFLHVGRSMIGLNMGTQRALPQSAPKIQSLEAELYSMILSQTDNGLCRYTYKDGRRCRKSMHRLGVHCFSEHVLHDHVEEELEELQRGSLQMGDAQIINNQIRKTFVEANLWWCHGCGNFSLYEFMIETHIIQYCDFSLSKGITRPRLGPPKGLAEGQQAEPPETTAGRIPK